MTKRHTDVECVTSIPPKKRRRLDIATKEQWDYYLPAACAIDSEAEPDGPCTLPRCSLDQKTQANKLYTRLADWQIRILALYPGSPNDGLKSGLRLAALHVNDGCILLEDTVKIQYEALSYCLGAPYFDCQIECNGVDFPVTEHLYTALWHLRNKHKIRYLWIDALCVNQHDLLERSVQVAKMLSIYQNAKQVSVWLGTSNNATSTVQRYIDRRRRGEVVYTPYGVCCPMGRISSRGATKNMLEERELSPWYNDNGNWRIVPEACYSHGRAILVGLHDLLTRPWYSRLWVKQEIWAARRLQFMCSSDSFDWDNLRTAAATLSHKLREVNRSFANPFHAFETRHEFLQDRNLGELGEILQLLQRTSNSKCSDPRDHVYAILGMTKIRHGASKPGDGETAYFPIDYRIPVRDVYVTFTRFLIRESRGLDVLEEVAMATPRHKSDKVVGAEWLPSWCPDWGIAWDFTSLRGTRVPMKGAVDISEALSLEHSDILYLRGVQIGTLLELQSKAPAGIRTVDPRELQRSKPERFRASKVPFFYIEASKIKEDFIRGRGGQQSSDVFEKFLDDCNGSFIRKAQKNDLVILASGFSRPVILRHQQPYDTYVFVSILQTEHNLWTLGYDMADPYWFNSKETIFAVA